MNERISDISGGEKLLKPVELAEALRVPVSWVYQNSRQRGNNTIPLVRVGPKYIRFQLSKVMAWLDEAQNIER